MQPSPLLLPGESQGRGSLVGCHLCRTESDTTEATQQQQHRILHRNTNAYKYACSLINTHKLIPSHVWPFKVSTAIFTKRGHGGQEPPAPRPQLGNGPSSLSPLTAFPMSPSLPQWPLVWVPLCYPLISAPSHLHQAVPLAWKPSPWSPT